ncbi:MAG: cellulase family glycosylhydrolase [Fibrobacter sp.]|uniref:cellulase family glycosylhydrolase n=1 Tax=Fibrobacter sp. TaxID=35828 RepID=UPI0025BB5991|nr:cellulase family glycosylhydrolase [Fibrobacter sp.]MBR4784780.1 cellulase family glycosylhydrolase [Fibrobacter sp.]
MTRISKTIKALAAGALLLGAVEANAAASTAKPLRVGPVQVHGALGTNGNKIVGQKSGKEAMIRGMSMFWSDATGIQYYNKEVIKWAVDNLKIDVFRYAMGIQYYDSDGGSSNPLDEKYSYFSTPESQTGKIDIMVEAAIENDIYIIIDWHSHRAYDGKEKPKAKAFFSEMAAKYKNVPNIIWEVFNEPAGSYNDWGQIKSYANDVIGGIRSAGSKNLALVGTPNWSQMGSCGGVSGDNIGYVFHFYAGTHSVGSYGGAVTSCKNGGNAVFITEWGTTTADGKSDANTSASSDWTNFMEQNKISNCNWSLRQKVTKIGNASDEGSAMFAGDKALTKQSDLATASYTNSGNFVKKYLTGHATNWASEYASTLKSGSCSFSATTVKETAGSVASSFKSGCTYTSSDESVVTSAGAVKSAGFVIMTGNDGSQSVIVVTAEPKQTISGFVDFNCFTSGDCTRGKQRRDLDQDGKTMDVIVSASGETDQGSKFTVQSLNPEIVKIKKATCSNSKSCFGQAEGASVYMYEFTGTLGTAKIVATAPATTGYIAFNDTITVKYAKMDDKLGDNFKSMTVDKGAVIPGFFASETFYGKAPIYYTFDGAESSIYLVNSEGFLITADQDATVAIRAVAAETTERAAIDSTVIVIVGNGGKNPIMAQKPQAAFKAKFNNEGIMLTSPKAGLASVEIFTALGHVEKSQKVMLGAGTNWIPVEGMSAGKYFVRIKQGSNFSSYTWEKK